MFIGAPRAIAERIKNKYPGTMVTETLIRRLMDSGEIPYINNGVKRITSEEAVMAYLQAHVGVEALKACVHSQLGGGIVHE